MKTPELEKIASNRDDSQKIGEFLAWLSDAMSIDLCISDGVCPDGDHEMYFPTDLNTEKLLAEYFEIDLNKAEKERQGLLDELRASNA